jgi:hypothetical protein
MDHLFFGCGLAKLAWQVVLCAFYIVKLPESVANLFGGWINPFSKSQRNLVLCGASALCWTLCKTRSDACFNQKFPNDPTTVIYRPCSMLTGWAILQIDQDRGKVETSVAQLNMVIREDY